MTKRYFKDFYGCTDSIGKTRDGKFRLKVAIPGRTGRINKVYDTERGARIALGRSSDGWNEVKRGKSL